ncbi:MAG: hypothetical protein IKL25_10920 [Clostridia bacterium]|nr:hypothetical protein [Clostridia bacterium]
MKKMLSFLMAMLMLLAAAPASACDEVYNPLPDHIAALFDVPAWDGFEVARCDDTDNWLSWVYSEEMDAGVVIMTNGSLHIVCLIEPDSKGNMRITQRNYKMVVGDAMPRVEVSWGNAYEQITPPWGEKRMFELVSNNGCHISFGKFDGVWRVKIVWDYVNNSIALVNDEKIGYIQGEVREDYVDYEMNRVKYVYGTYDNRFAAFNIYDFPRNLKDARAKLTNPPVTPTDFYTPVNVTLRANEKYDVFAAPGRSSYRAANGKAELSTNDWVQIFGEEDGWLLVQYDIGRDQMRFGYIAASALPKNTQVQALRWYDLPEQTVKANTYVTDDPLVSRDIICWLNAGDKVEVLSDFGSWYYVEVTPGTGRTLRGFIPQTAVDLITWDGLAK